MNLIMVPFLLAAHVPPNKYNTPMYPEFTYHIQVNNLLAVFEDTTTKFLVSNFTSKLMCNSTAQDKLSCYIKSPELTVTWNIPSTRTNDDLEKRTVKIPIHYNNNIQMEMVFDYLGIEQVNIPDGILPSTFFLKLFRVIGDLMSIGIDMYGKENTGSIWDESYLGRCLTEYTVDDTFVILDFTSSKFTLKSIADFKLEDNRIKDIKKYRHIHTCRSFNDYMLMDYEDITSPFHHRMHESISQMQIATKLFTSEIQNSYRLYNQDEEKIGIVVEHVKLHLDGIEHV